MNLKWRRSKTRFTKLCLRVGENGREVPEKQRRNQHTKFSLMKLKKFVNYKSHITY